MIDTLVGEGVDFEAACDAAENSLSELLNPVYSRMFNEYIEIQTNCENAAATVTDRIREQRGQPQQDPEPPQTSDEQEVVRRSRFERDEVV
jgi:hypothetical protein